MHGADQIEDSSVEILLQELVFSFGLLVGDLLRLGAEEGTPLFLSHVMHPLNLFLPLLESEI